MGACVSFSEDGRVFWLCIGKGCSLFDLCFPFLVVRGAGYHCRRLDMDIAVSGTSAQ